MGTIEDRLKASLKYDVINGDDFEKSVLVSQIKEAIETIEKLRIEGNNGRIKTTNKGAEKMSWNKKERGGNNHEIARIF